MIATMETRLELDEDNELVEYRAPSFRMPSGVSVLTVDGRVYEIQRVHGGACVVKTTDSLVNGKRFETSSIKEAKTLLWDFLKN